jgi:hypothetical protein
VILNVVVPEGPGEPEEPSICANNRETSVTRIDIEQAHLKIENAAKATSVSAIEHELPVDTHSQSGLLTKFAPNCVICSTPSYQPHVSIENKIRIMKAKAPCSS